MKNLKEELTEKQIEKLFEEGFLNIKDKNENEAEYEIDTDYKNLKLKCILKCFNDKFGNAKIERYSIK